MSRLHSYFRRTLIFSHKIITLRSNFPSADRTSIKLHTTNSKRIYTFGVSVFFKRHIHKHFGLYETAVVLKMEEKTKWRPMEIEVFGRSNYTHPYALSAAEGRRPVKFSIAILLIIIVALF